MTSLARSAARLTLVTALALAGASCASDPDPGSSGPNPFLENQATGKADTGYLNMAGMEVEATLEADVQGATWNAFEAPPNLAQFATTYLHKRYEIYVMIVNEDSTAPDRVEWLVDGEWINAAAARQLPSSKLTHFRMPAINVVMLNQAARNVTEGQVLTAKVPLKPYSIYSDAGDTCADYNSHISLSQSVYWYLWNPDKSGCKAELQDMTLTITKVTPKNPTSYPEYDKLWEDNELSVVVLFGKLDDGDNIQDDYNWHAADRFVTWLTGAGFTEVADAPLGRRFRKAAGDKSETVDIYYPDVFEDPTDYRHIANWRKAQQEHEVVIYLGHSVLGTGSAYDDVDYPEFYQIQFIGGCLAYEYYVRPVLEGKGGWENVDAVASILENYYNEMNDATGAFLAKLFYGFEHGGQASWQDIMAAINNRLGHEHFGVAGARENCFTPSGNRCTTPPPAGNHYATETPAAIPDNDPAGATSTITVPDSLTVGTLAVTLDVTHTYVGDLTITLTHGDVTATLWDRTGGRQQDIAQTFTVDAFHGQDAQGDWILKVVDSAAMDDGTVNTWSLDVTAAQ
jgi:hypothetical protein